MTLKKNMTKELIYQAFFKKEGERSDAGFIEQFSPEEIMYHFADEKIEKDDIYISQNRANHKLNIWYISVSCETRDASTIVDLYVSNLKKLDISGFTFYATEELYSPPYKYKIENIQTVILQTNDKLLEEKQYEKIEKKLLYLSKDDELEEKLRLFEERYTYYVEELDLVGKKEKDISKILRLIRKSKCSEREIVFEILNVGGWGFTYDLNDYVEDFKKIFDYLAIPSCQIRI